MLGRFLSNYVRRHRHPGNILLHVVGLPLTFVAPVACLVRDRPAWALVCFVAGYGLQFLSHAVEGNDAGEVVLVRRRLGLPYVEFGPRETGA